MSGPTCRSCYAATLTDDQRERFNAEPVTTSVYLCDDHQRAMDAVLANMPPMIKVDTTRAITFDVVAPEDDQ